MGFAFFAASPRLPLRKGLTEGGVAGFNYLNSIYWMIKKLFTKLNDFI